MSVPFSKRCVAKECLSVWQWTEFPSSALFAADEIIFCKFLVVSFPDLPEKTNCWFSFFCCST